MKVVTILVIVVCWIICTICLSISFIGNGFIAMIASCVMACMIACGTGIRLMKRKVGLAAMLLLLSATVGWLLGNLKQTHYLTILALIVLPAALTFIQKREDDRIA